MSCQHEMKKWEFLNLEFIVKLSYCRKCGVTREQVLEEALREIVELWDDRSTDAANMYETAEKALGEK